MSPYGCNVYLILIAWRWLQKSTWNHLRLYSLPNTRIVNIKIWLKKKTKWTKGRNSRFLWCALVCLFISRCIFTIIVVARYRMLPSCRHHIFFLLCSRWPWIRGCFYINNRQLLCYIHDNAKTNLNKMSDAFAFRITQFDIIVFHRKTRDRMILNWSEICASFLFLLVVLRIIFWLFELNHQECLSQSNMLLSCFIKRNIFYLW